MPSPHSLCLRALIPALVLGAPLSAHLVIRPLPAMVQSGTTLSIEVEVTDRASSGTLTLLAWEGDQVVYRSERPLLGFARERFTMPIPPKTTAQDLVVQARAGTVHSPRVAFRLIPAVAGLLPVEGGDEAPAAIKHSRSVIRPSSSTSPLDSLTALPPGLARHVATFDPGALRMVSRKLNQAAQLATDHLTIQGGINNTELTRLLQNHRMIRSIWFQDTPNLSPKGILRALAPCRRLTTLKVTCTKLTFGLVREILTAHPTVIHLIYENELDVQAAEVDLLPDRLESLSLSSAGLRDEALLRFANLKDFRIRNSQVFTGDRLPAGLQSLQVENGPLFTGNGLPASLTNLQVHGADRFQGLSGLPRLQDLSIRECAGVSLENLREAVLHAPGLQTFSTDQAAGILLEALPEGVRELHFHNAGGVAPDAFARFAQLRVLDIQSAPGFTGAHLPAGLTVLNVTACPHFGLNPLPARLENLQVLWCASFSGQGLPGSLRSLEVECLRALTLDALMALVDQLKGLQSLTIHGVWEPNPDASRWQAHPALREVTCYPTINHSPRIWRRPVPRKIPLIAQPEFGDIGMEAPEAPAPSGRRGKAASSSSTSSTVPCGLAALPVDALVTIADFTGPGALRYLSERLNEVAETATRQLTIRGEIDDEDLHALILKHPHVETLAFGFTPHLSPKGILAALAHCRQLRTLVVGDSLKLTFPLIKAIIDTHDQLVCLRITNDLEPAAEDRMLRVDMLTDAQLALLPERMEELEFPADDVRDETLRRFQGLRRLAVSNNIRSFHGDDLPAGLTSLRITACWAFTGRRLPAGLEELHLKTVFTAPDFGPLPRLRTLSVLNWAANLKEALVTLWKNTPSLTRVELDSHAPDLISALPASLTELRIQGDPERGMLPDGAFARLARLEHLSVAGSATFSGQGLPLSLRCLEIRDCPNLTREALGPLLLTRLAVEESGGFTCFGLPATLRDLRVEACPGVTMPLMLTALPGLPNLAHLAITEARGTALTALVEAKEGPMDEALLRAHPTLLTLVHAPDPHSEFTWQRPAAGR